LWGWIPERRPEAEFSAAGWAGCMALPRVLSLSAENDLEMRVASQAETLRAKKLCALGSADTWETRNKALALMAMKDVAGELRWRAARGPFSMAILDNAGPWWWLNFENTGSATLMQVCGKKIELPSETSPQREFHLLLDASVAEFFCNSLHVLTTRIYREPAGPLRVEISGDSVGRLGSFEAWQLRPISNDRLTT
jgi:beta-fructofuranosidase